MEASAASDGGISIFCTYYDVWPQHFTCQNCYLLTYLHLYYLSKSTFCVHFSLWAHWNQSLNSILDWTLYWTFVVYSGHLFLNLRFLPVSPQTYQRSHTQHENCFFLFPRRIRVQVGFWPRSALPRCHGSVVTHGRCSVPSGGVSDAFNETVCSLQQCIEIIYKS